jgi:hypothetical protein
MTDQPKAPEAGLTDAECLRIVRASIDPQRVLSGPDGHDGGPPDVLLTVVQDILAARAAQPDWLLCGQCGEQPAAMVKVGTDDGWCTHCLDEAAEPAQPDVGTLRDAVERPQCPHEVVPATCPDCNCPCGGCDRHRAERATTDAALLAEHAPEPSAEGGETP